MNYKVLVISFIYLLSSLIKWISIKGIDKKRKCCINNINFKMELITVIMSMIRLKISKFYRIKLSK